MSDKRLVYCRARRQWPLCDPSVGKNGDLHKSNGDEVANVSCRRLVKKNVAERILPIRKLLRRLVNKALTPTSVVEALKLPATHVGDRKYDTVGGAIFASSELFYHQNSPKLLVNANHVLCIVLRWHLLSIFPTFHFMQMFPYDDCYDQKVGKT